MYRAKGKKFVDVIEGRVEGIEKVTKLRSVIKKWRLKVIKKNVLKNETKLSLKNPSFFKNRAFTTTYILNFTFITLNSGINSRKESQYVGVGVAISESGTHCIVVVRYWPAGKYIFVKI